MHMNVLYLLLCSLFVVESLFFVLLFGFCPFCLRIYVACSSAYCCCFRLLSMSMSSVYFLSPLCHLSFSFSGWRVFCVTNCDNVVWWLCAVGLCWCKRVFVCMYVSVGCVCVSVHRCVGVQHTP